MFRAGTAEQWYSEAVHETALTGSDSGTARPWTLNLDLRLRGTDTTVTGGTDNPPDSATVAQLALALSPPQPASHGGFTGSMNDGRSPTGTIPPGGSGGSGRSSTVAP